MVIKWTLHRHKRQLRVMHIRRPEPLLMEYAMVTGTRAGKLCTREAQAAHQYSGLLFSMLDMVTCAQDACLLVHS